VRETRKASSRGSIALGLHAVVLAVAEETPRVLVVEHPWWMSDLAGKFRGPVRPEDLAEALPFGAFDPGRDRTLELGLRRWVRHWTGSDLGYVEQLYTFGSRFRDPLERQGGPRVVSVAYLALVRERVRPRASRASWRDVYAYLPWEDWREGRPPSIVEAIEPALARWIESAPSEPARRARRERAELAFGLAGIPWDEERVLDRYELLYEIGAVEEARRDRAGPARSRGEQPGPSPVRSTPMALDHRRMLASALGRLRGKLKYRPVVFELLPPEFTLSELQRTVEALAGVRLHKQNFRRLVERNRLVEPTGGSKIGRAGRPAALFRFRKDVLRERPAPGVGLPGAPRSAS
jgi:hypothetical protein